MSSIVTTIALQGVLGFQDPDSELATMTVSERENVSPEISTTLSPTMYAPARAYAWVAVGLEETICCPSPKSQLNVGDRTPKELPVKVIISPGRGVEGDHVKLPGGGGDFLQAVRGWSSHPENPWLPWSV
jgi:hypothetical protein